MKSAWALALVILLVPSFSGCFEALEGLVGPQHAVSSTPLEVGSDVWNTDNQFRVVVGEDPEVPDATAIRIVAREVNGDRTVENEGIGDVTLEIPDGTWTVTYYVDGRKWNSLSPVRVDSSLPALSNLAFVADAQPGGSYTIGEGAVVEPGARVQVFDLQTGGVVSESLPHTVTGLQDGLQVYLVRIVDGAGNVWEQNVQIRVGSAAALPEGQFSFGIVARYTIEARVWDMSQMGAYYDPDAAQKAVSGSYMGKGYAIDPDDSLVQAVVAQEVSSGMTTAEIAFELFEWMFNNLEYDETRLSTDTLLQPHQVLGDEEDASDKDADGDGLVGDGAGNGVAGGICRDLAATYVSLLRAAGVPARLVSGYLGGEVDGFHAWVEFYGGPVMGQDPWIPVDVSPIDGLYDDNTMLQAFAIQLPEYLPLRSVPPSSEIEGWSTALSMHYTWPQRESEPQVTFEKQVTTIWNDWGVLCVDPAAKNRMLASDSNECSKAGFKAYVGKPDGPSDRQGFLLRTERVIDYGIDVAAAPKAAKISAEVAYPFKADVAPNSVDYIHYGPAWEKDVLRGKITTEFTPSEL